MKVWLVHYITAQTLYGGGVFDVQTVAVSAATGAEARDLVFSQTEATQVVKYEEIV